MRSVNFRCARHVRAFFSGEDANLNQHRYGRSLEIRERLDVAKHGKSRDQVRTRRAHDYACAQIISIIVHKIVCAIRRDHMHYKSRFVLCAEDGGHMQELGQRGGAHRSARHPRHTLNKDDLVE